MGTKPTLTAEQARYRSWAFGLLTASLLFCWGPFCGLNYFTRRYLVCFSPVPQRVAFGGPVHLRDGCFSFRGFFGTHILSYTYPDGTWYRAEIYPKLVEPDDSSSLTIDRDRITGSPQARVVAEGEGSVDER